MAVKAIPSRGAAPREDHRAFLFAPTVPPLERPMLELGLGYAG